MGHPQDYSRAILSHRKVGHPPTEVAVRQQGLTGVFKEVPVVVGDETVRVSGNVVNGVVMIGTAYK